MWLLGNSSRLEPKFGENFTVASCEESLWDNVSSVSLCSCGFYIFLQRNIDWLVLVSVHGWWMINSLICLMWTTGVVVAWVMGNLVELALWVRQCQQNNNEFLPFQGFRDIVKATCVMGEFRTCVGTNCFRRKGMELLRLTHVSQIKRNQ